MTISDLSPRTVRNLLFFTMIIWACLFCIDSRAHAQRQELHTNSGEPNRHANSPQEASGFAMALTRNFNPSRGKIENIQPFLDKNQWFHIKFIVWNDGSILLATGEEHNPGQWNYKFDSKPHFRAIEKIAAIWDAFDLAPPEKDVCYYIFDNGPFYNHYYQLRVCLEEGIFGVKTWESFEDASADRIVLPSLFKRNKKPTCLPEFYEIWKQTIKNDLLNSLETGLSKGVIPVEVVYNGYEFSVIDNDRNIVVEGDLHPFIIGSLDKVDKDLLNGKMYNPRYKRSTAPMPIQRMTDSPKTKAEPMKP